MPALRLVVLGNNLTPITPSTSKENEPETLLAALPVTALADDSASSAPTNSEAKTTTKQEISLAALADESLSPAA